MWKRETFWVEVCIWRVSINDLRRFSSSLLTLLFRDRCSDITACKNYFRNTKDNERKQNRPISLEKTKYIYFIFIFWTRPGWKTEAMNSLSLMTCLILFIEDNTLQFDTSEFIYIKQLCNLNQFPFLFPSM